MSVYTSGQEGPHLVSGLVVNGVRPLDQPSTVRVVTSLRTEFAFPIDENHVLSVDTQESILYFELFKIPGSEIPGQRVLRLIPWSNVVAVHFEWPALEDTPERWQQIIQLRQERVIEEAKAELARRNHGTEQAARSSIKVN